MTYQELEELIDQMEGEEANILFSKGKEYGGQSEALENFYATAEETGLTPIQVVFLFMNKHYRSIRYFVKNSQTLSEPIEERIMDMRVYLSLLRAIIQEQKRRTSHNETRRTN